MPTFFVGSSFLRENSPKNRCLGLVGVVFHDPWVWGESGSPQAVELPSPPLAPKAAPSPDLRDAIGLASEGADGLGEL